WSAAPTWKEMKRRAPVFGTSQAAIGSRQDGHQDDNARKDVNDDPHDGPDQAAVCSQMEVPDINVFGYGIPSGPERAPGGQAGQRGVHVGGWHGECHGPRQREDKIDQDTGDHGLALRWYPDGKSQPYRRHERPLDEDQSSN